MLCAIVQLTSPLKPKAELYPDLSRRFNRKTMCKTLYIRGRPHSQIGAQQSC